MAEVETYDADDFCDAVRIELRGMRIWIVPTEDDITIEAVMKPGFVMAEQRRSVGTKRTFWRIDGIATRPKPSGTIH